jgi:hypothetical protein
VGERRRRRLVSLKADLAIANAAFHATGKRVRELPITIDKLLDRELPSIAVKHSQGQSPLSLVDRLKRGALKRQRAVQEVIVRARQELRRVDDPKGQPAVLAELGPEQVGKSCRIESSRTRLENDQPLILQGRTVERKDSRNVGDFLVNVAGRFRFG